MAVKIVTDSTVDLPLDLVNELGIAIVPVHVRFGDITYMDGIDINSDELMYRLASEPVFPATSQPSPDDFIKVYSGFTDPYEAILSIHVSARTSGTYDSALLAKSMLQEPDFVEVVDSKLTSAGLAIIVMKAARMAIEGSGLYEIKCEVDKAIQETQILGVFNTMEFLAKGGRVNKAIANISGLLDIKPLLTFRDGEIVRAGLVRTFSKGIDRLYKFAVEKRGIQEIIVSHSAIPDIAEELKKRLNNIFPEKNILVTKLGAALGTHGGPGVLVVAVRYSDT